MASIRYIYLHGYINLKVTQCCETQHYNNLFPVSVLYFLAIAIGISEKSVSTNSARSFWSHCATLATPAAAATGVDKAKPRIEQLNQNRHQHWASGMGHGAGGEGEGGHQKLNQMFIFRVPARPISDYICRRSCCG